MASKQIGSEAGRAESREGGEDAGGWLPQLRSEKEVCRIATLLQGVVRQKKAPVMGPAQRSVGLGGRKGGEKGRERREEGGRRRAGQRTSVSTVGLSRRCWQGGWDVKCGTTLPSSRPMLCQPCEATGKKNKKSASRNRKRAMNSSYVGRGQARGVKERASHGR